MNINKMINLTQDVALYQKGTGVMWTDEHIYRQLLKAHIDTSNDLASRNDKSIDKTVDWIINEFGAGDGAVLDIGCGPGLYTERFAEKGYSVTGVDYSKNSIAYAKNSAKEKQLDIEYFCQNYLELNFAEEADLIIMIYCDFCVLTKSERDTLLKNIYSALTPGGTFIFDAYNEKALQDMNFDKSWEFSEGGFWQAEPYLALSAKQLFGEHNVVLNQHIVFDENDDYTTYHFWEHYYSEEDIKAAFLRSGFACVKSKGNVLQSSGQTGETGITFYKAVK